eukprot:Gb_01591 [translate_table: standard]
MVVVELLQALHWRSLPRPGQGLTLEWTDVAAVKQAFRKFSLSTEHQRGTKSMEIAKEIQMVCVVARPPTLPTRVLANRGFDGMYGCASCSCGMGFMPMALDVFQWTYRQACALNANRFY